MSADFEVSPYQDKVYVRVAEDYPGCACGGSASVFLTADEARTFAHQLLAAIHA